MAAMTSYQMGKDGIPISIQEAGAYFRKNPNTPDALSFFYEHPEEKPRIGSDEEIKKLEKARDENLNDIKKHQILVNSHKEKSGSSNPFVPYSSPHESAMEYSQFNLLAAQQKQKEIESKLEELKKFAPDVTIKNQQDQNVVPATAKRLSDSNTSQQQTTNPGEKPSNLILDSGVNLSNVDQNLLSRLYAAAAEYGKSFKVNSGFRDDKKQAELWVRGNILHEPGIYMPAMPSTAQKINYKGQSYDVPGSGKPPNSHASGAALDIDASAASEMDSMGILQKNGLSRPFANDPVHIQLAGASGKPDVDPVQNVAQTPATPNQITSNQPPATMQQNTPSSGVNVKTASETYDKSKRIPTPSTAPSVVPVVSTQSSKSNNSPVESFYIDPNDPGPVEPIDAALRYAKLFNMVA